MMVAVGRIPLIMIEYLAPGRIPKVTSTVSLVTRKAHLITDGVPLVISKLPLVTEMILLVRSRAK